MITQHITGSIFTLSLTKDTQNHKYGLNSALSCSKYTPKVLSPTKLINLLLKGSNDIKKTNILTAAIGTKTPVEIEDKSLAINLIFVSSTQATNSTSVIQNIANELSNQEKTNNASAQNLLVVFFILLKNIPIEKNSNPL